MSTAFRFANEGADENTWAQYVLAMERINIGVNTCKLYNDGGVLKLSKGRIGIDDGTQPSICEIDTVETIALTGNTSQWQEVYMTVAGTAVSFATADIVGATDPRFLPAGFTGVYNAEKEGYYINADRRCIGIVWVNAAGTLEGIINTLNNADGFEGYALTDDANDWIYTYSKYKGFINYGGYFEDGASPTQNTIYDVIADALKNVGDEMPVNGGFSAVGAGAELYTMSFVKARRTAADTITFTAVGNSTAGIVGIATYAAQNGSALKFTGHGSTDVAMSWGKACTKE